MKQIYPKIIRWSARVLGTFVILFGLPFYFGYGNPLPFMNPAYTWIENLWLSITPVMFIGLGLGWRYEKIGGYIVTVPLGLGMLLGIIFEKELLGPALIPLIAGVLYLISGYKSKRN